MQSWFWNLAAVVICLLSVATGRAQSITSERSLPSRQVLARYGLELDWWGQGVLNPTRDKVVHLSCDEDCVYVQASNGIITAFDLLTGQRRWAIQQGEFDPPSFQAVSNEEIVMVVVGSSVYGVNKISGETLWELRLPGQPSTSPATDEKHLYVGMLDGSVYAFDLKEIRNLFVEHRLPEWSHQTIVWRFSTSKEITSPPVVIGTRICLASRDGNVYAVTSDRRELIFQFETDAPIVAPITRVGEVLFLTSEDNSFYALRVKPKLDAPKNQKQVGEGAVREDLQPLRDTESGKILWQFTMGRPIRKPPYAIGPDVFLLPHRGGFYSYSVKSGEQNWWQPRGSSFVATTREHVYVSDPDENLLILDRSNGAVTGSLPLRQFPIRYANDRTDRILLATSTGLVVVLRETQRSIPTYHMFPDRLPLLPEFASENDDSNTEDVEPKAEE